MATGMAEALMVGTHPEKVELAYEEGHDADIPSNAGVILERSESSIHGSDADKDLEKAGGPTSSRSSTHETSNEKKNNTIEEVVRYPSVADENVVDWDGPEDPANPMNWSTRKKAYQVAILSLLTLVTPLASSMFAPAVPEVMEKFHSSSNTLAAFVVSVYILGFAIGPLVVSPLSEMYGRYIVYNVANFFFIVFTIACAVANSMGMLIAFRFLAGMAGIAPVTIGGGTIADMIVQERRGGVMAIWAMGPLIGPVIGPVAGSYLAGSLGWRWVFWVLAMASGLFSLINVAITSETYAPVLLARKAARMRKETGNLDLRSKLDIGLTPRELFLRSIVRPTKMLIFSPIVLLMSLYMAVSYGIMYLLFTTFTFVFTENYNFTEDNVGLTYIATGVGMLIALLILGMTSDRLVVHLKNKNGGEMKPEYRLPPLIFFGAFIPVGLFIYGWTAQYHVHWAVPLLGTMLVGIGILAAFMCVQSYLIDAFTVHAASAIAANTVLRSIFGAVLPLCGLQMYDVLGLGWGNSLIGFVALALVAVPPLLWFYGERIRTSPRFRVQF